MPFHLLHPDSQFILYYYHEKCLDLNCILIVILFISEIQEVVYNHLSSSLVTSRYGREKKKHAYGITSILVLN
jgi:hypothetical protein